MGSPFIDELSLHDFRHQHQRETEDDVNPCKIKELPAGSSFSFCLTDQLTTPAKLTFTSLFTVYVYVNTYLPEPPEVGLVKCRFTEDGVPSKYASEELLVPVIVILAPAGTLPLAAVFPLYVNVQLRHVTV